MGIVADIQTAYERYVDTVYRICYSYLGSAADAEDAVQDVFIRLMNYEGEFQDQEHLKAWLIRVAVNRCKDVLRSSARKNVALDEVEEPLAPSDEYDATLDAVMRLDPKYKDVVYLYYYEDRPCEEIAAILGRPASTVRNHLSEARAILREKLGR